MKKEDANQDKENKSYGEKVSKWAGIVVEIATLVGSVVAIIGKVKDEG